MHFFLGALRVKDRERKSVTLSLRVMTFVASILEFLYVVTPCDWKHLKSENTTANAQLMHFK